MRYIKSFADHAAIQGAMNEGTLGFPYLALNDETHKIEWTDYSKMYLTIKALEDGDFNINHKCSYSINNGSWTEVASGTVLSLSDGDNVRFKNTAKITDDAFKCAFSGNTIGFEVYGNIMSIRYGDNFTTSNVFKSRDAEQMFYNCTGLTTAENLVLPATELDLYCYRRMFQGCTNLVKAPKVLPAMEVPMNAYDGMFLSCSSLVEPPAILATSMKTQQSCLYMFRNCTSLEKAPDLLTETLTPSCYQEMFSGCSNLKYIKCMAKTFGSYSTRNWLQDASSTGTFVKKAGVSWSRNVSGIPSGWTVINA